MWDRRTRRRVVSGALCLAVAGGGLLGLLISRRNGDVLAAPAHGEAASTGAGALAAWPPPSAAPLVSPPGTPAFARVRGLILYLPAPKPVGVAYHEAFKDAALRLRPLGRCVRNENRTKFNRPAVTEGPDYMVMSSRGRGHAATSAVDVALAEGAVILSPVTGTVASVRRYRLYGAYRDFRVALRPEGHDRLRAIILHVTGLQVMRGSDLVAGVTVIGSVRSFPFRSQVNDYVGVGISHVHIEVKRRGA
jgi:hypothetical protein